MSDTRKDEAANKRDSAIREAMRRLGDEMLGQLKPDDRLSRALSENNVGKKEPD
jgi:hypothetical protein